MRIIVDSKERRQLAVSLVQGIRREDCPMDVTIEPHVDDKTAEQRGLFHTLCREIASDTGYSEGQIKEAIKKSILGTKLIEIAGQQYEVTSSSEIGDDGKPRDRLSYSDLIEGAYELQAKI